MTRVLIVDDNEQNVYLLQALLTGYRYEVVSATNGVEALAKARRDPPNMVISGILMPVMDGFTLCREWKKDEQLKRIPFVFYTTTYTDSKVEEFALSLGADRFIVKPVEPDVFVEMLREIIAEREAGTLSAARTPHGLVLVIDDEAPVREAVTDILESEGLTVLTAADGIAGVTAYRERQADIRLVLLDLSMPGLNGVDTFQALRQINPMVSVILSSGYSQDEATRRFAGQGLAGFLQKPYDVETLVNLVLQQLNRHADASGAPII